MSDYKFPPAMRQVIQDALPEYTSSFGNEPDLRYTYMPAGHAKALNPDTMLVEGIRGAGKSFWWSALQSPEHRSMFNKVFPKIGIDRDTIVSSGFGEKPISDYPSKDVLLKLLESNLDARQIWRTVVLRSLSAKHKIGDTLLRLKDWPSRVQWVANNPEEADNIASIADEKLEESGVYQLILFDALDRTSDKWEYMFTLINGLLQVLLDFRYYKRIRLKAFVRPDHIEGASVTAFSDSSKMLSQKVDLNWPRNDLYGLLWQHLANEPNGGHIFRDGCKKFLGIEFKQHQDVWLLQDKLRNDEEMQKIFHAITGPWMGSDRRRGKPYSWLPSHLGDTRRQVSPRSFLAALRKAAEDNSFPSHTYVLHYESIKRGVAKASEIRVDEMKEDYPWVDTLMKPLKGLSIPCEFKEIRDRWKRDNALAKISKEIENTSVKLPPSRLTSGPDGVRKDLESLGLFERMSSDDRVNLPDVYRVAYGMGRRGGVKAVAR